MALKTRSITYELADLPIIVNQLQAWGLMKYKVVTLTGDLGAGKTTLVKAIGKELGVEDHMSSPTFALVNTYQGKNIDIYHIDLYRIEDIEEALQIGIEEYLYGDGICFIEWPEVIESLLPEQYLSIKIENLGNFTRKLLYQPTDSTIE